MRNPPRRMLTVIPLLLAISLSPLVTVSLIGEEKPQESPAQTKQLKIKGVKTTSVQVSSELLKQLTGKRQFDSEFLRKALTYRDEIPILELPSGRKVALESIRAETKPTLEERMKSLTIHPKVWKYLPYIRADWIGRFHISTGPPDNVDHSPCQSPVRDQGDRGTCTAFASMAGYEGFASCSNQQTLDLSEQHTYHIFMQQIGSYCRSDRGIYTWQGAGYLTSHHVCAESGMPYTSTLLSLPTNDNTHVPPECSGNAPYGFVTTQTMFGTAFGGDATVNANNTNYLESILSSGYDIVYGIYCAGSDWSDATAEKGVIDVQLAGGKPAPAYAGHAMLLVGYDRPKQYFIFKNSWGTDQGHVGYLHISYNYLQTYGKYGYYITGITP